MGDRPQHVMWHDRVLGVQVIAGPFSAVTRRRLRILAYHGVDCLDPFAAQMAWVAEHCQPVALEDVAAALAGQARLPDRAVWVTFDDGHPEVVETAQPVLDQHGIAATLFVCPAFIDTNEPFWWDIVADAGELGVDWSTDAERQEAVARARARVTATLGTAPTRRQLRSEALRDWLAAGHSVGNHSWDHPRLDMCEPAEQTEQVVRADAWLNEFGVEGPRMFAYPEGNWTAHAEGVLRDLGYHAGLLFDHRLTRINGSPFRMSRLRVDADASLPRFRSIVSGSHSAMFQLFHRDR